MYSSHKNVLQTVALLKAYGIAHIVISPGSRNIPLIQSFTCDPFFNCWSIVDERSASYFAIGLIYRVKKPVALCCTSGSALLNYAPAVAEAFYHRLPLVVISADRSQAWIGQMDGQTINQSGAFGKLANYSVQLPEIHTDDECWYCNRLINEALICCSTPVPGPIHINIPISEPLFAFTEERLPDVRCIKAEIPDKSVNMRSFCDEWNDAHKRMILVGQQFSDPYLTTLLEKLTEKTDSIVLREHLANLPSSRFIGNFDALIGRFTTNEIREFAPDLLITLGGHLVSKKIKTFLREYKPKRHWHLSAETDVPDTYQSLTQLINVHPVAFLEKLTGLVKADKERPFAVKWNEFSHLIPPPTQLQFSDISVTGRVLNSLPSFSTLIVANSSPVRNIQLFSLKEQIDVLCNRGTNGIEGSISTAAGYTATGDGLTFLLLGDLSFFHDLSALNNSYLSGNLRIILINNGGGGIFQLLSGLKRSETLESYVTAQHTHSAEAWIKAAGLTYIQANDEQSLEAGLSELVKPNAGKCILLEVFTVAELNKAAFEQYYSSLTTTNYV
ncbi:MAG: 2-succinyl-5-enolpyruvyl-6-hydroxy-3-cyclohexene-1-carboxylic-acid synthase [Bacteroidota bacterium]|nr:2-succinyl-5-enolpyruvyl-6-hydroxy-3-cyclohexene-1-carboxylic-acid synthase [Bacteroidota bacterium]